MKGQDNSTNSNNANTGANNEPAGANNKNKGTNNNPVAFDDFLKDRKNQAEFDRRVQKAIQTAQKKWKDKKEKSEEERLQYQYNIQHLNLNF